MAEDELRGSTPVMTAKDILLEVRSDVKAIGKNVDILISQDLDVRVTALERFQWRMIGLGGAGSLLGLIALILAIADRISAS